MRAEGIMSRKDMIQGERFRIHDRARALVAEVKDSPRGPQIILSRTHRDFLRRLLENEVPEIYHGVVEIRSIAREPGERAKVAVSATQSGIDPVGACVGIRGVRIQAIVRELHDEKIDVIEWNPDPAIFIAKAISPARVTGVYLNERSATGKTATVVVPEDQLSLAIGRDGQNARLAAKLTGWRIDIKSVSEAATDALYKLQNDATLAAIAQAEGATIVEVEVILGKKNEGRPLTPEEYDGLAHFVDRVEKRTARRQPEKVAEEEAELANIRKGIPAGMFDQSILDSSLPEHVSYILQEAGYSTIGELALHMKTHPDDVLRLQGIGPRAMTEINRLMETLEITAATELAAAKVEEVPAAEPSAPEVFPPVEVVAAETVVQETVVETAPTVEIQAEVPAEEAPVPESGVAEQPVISEEETSFDQLFALKPGIIEPAAEEEEEEEGTESAKDKKKKKKKKFVELTYDPDRDVVLAKKKHKRGGTEWDWEE
jgi:N utilization substance protein A